MTDAQWREILPQEDWERFAVLEQPTCNCGERGRAAWLHDMDCPEYTAWTEEES